MAADEVSRVLLTTGLLLGEALTPDDERLLDRVLGQLSALPQPTAVALAEPAGSLKHSGEAATIVVCKRRIDAGVPVIMLTNDGGASRVAASHGVRSRHLPQVLRELACADSALDADELFRAMERMTSVSTPPAECVPVSAEALRCLRGVDGVCELCS